MPSDHKATQTGTHQGHRNTKETLGCHSCRVWRTIPRWPLQSGSHIDKRTWYPEVAKTHSTASQPSKEKLKTMFATHGTPRQLKSDNGPPFNSRKWAEFAKTEGFHRPRVTPEHARANGEAESFMKLLNKTEQIAHLQGGNGNVAIQEMLTGYRSTPHPATGATPYEAHDEQTSENQVRLPNKGE